MTIPVNKIPLLQVVHGARYLSGHVHEDNLGDLRSVCVSQVVQEVAPRHELRDDVERRLPGANTQKLDQIGVLHLLHNGGFLQKI